MKQRRKIISGIIVCLVLAIAFFSGNQDFDKNNESSLNTASTESGEVIIPEELKPQASPTKEETKTQTTPEETEKIIETEEIHDEKEENTCSLSVTCDSVFENLEMLKEGKEEIIPAGGVVYNQQIVEFSEGESAFDVLYRELRKNNIHFEYVKTPMYDSMYIEGIANLYEFDCGNYSGWTYKVNGVKPTCGCSQYKIQKGDKIEFIYSCNFLSDEE